MSQPVVTEPTEETTALVKQGMGEIVKGKLTLGDLMERVVSPNAPAVPDTTPPLTQRLSEEEHQAIKDLPEVFGKTLVLKDRKLTAPEAEALVRERTIIDTVMGVIKRRKDDVIREYFANHADAVLEETLSPEDLAGVRKDKNGHYAPWETQNIPVEGTDRKIQRFASGGKPNLTIDDVEALHADGAIDRKTYLAMTKKPDYPRVLDEDGLHKAIQKDPRLFFLLASRAKAPNPTTTVKLEKNT